MGRTAWSRREMAGGGVMARVKAGELLVKDAGVVMKTS